MQPEITKDILQAQKNEITEHFIYKNLAKVMKDKENKKILEEISNDELKHYNFWQNYTKKIIKPNKFQIWKYFWTKIYGKR
jgi:rubrerythrin